MKFRNLAAAAAALTLTVTPVVAQAASAEVSRVAAPVSGESEFGADSTLLMIMAVLLFGTGLYLLINNKDDKAGSA